MNYYHLTADIDEEEDDIHTSGSKVNKVNDPVVDKISEIFGSIHNSSEAKNEAGQGQAVASQSLIAQPRQRRRRNNPLRQHRLRHLNTVSGYFNDWTQWLTSNEASTING